MEKMIYVDFLAYCFFGIINDICSRGYLFVGGLTKPMPVSTDFFWASQCSDSFLIFLGN